MKKLRKFFLCIFVFLLLICIACIGYLAGYAPAEPWAVEAMVSQQDITVEVRSELTVFSPALPDAGFVFYPGGKVEHTAYAPLMQALAKRNIQCVLVQMPWNMAVLKPNAGAEVPALFPEIDRWYIGGHSLGGSMAASCLNSHPSSFDGLVLLAAYSTEDLTGDEIPVLSIYGTQDGILNTDNYNQFRDCLPQDTREIILEGGNHSNFAGYGLQKGDREASLTAVEQIERTADEISDFFQA